MKKYKPTLLIIRDGWGENHNAEHDAFNAVKLAETPCADLLSKQWPSTEITACGLDVGLPENVMGNSEVGHQNIGAGRIVDQEIVRINKGLAGDSLLRSETWKEAVNNTKKHNSQFHLMGLVSNGGVHAMLDHLFLLLDLAKQSGLTEVFIHAFMDGRDTPPKIGLTFIEQLEAHCQKQGIGKIATISGRFWAMDRDQRWNRVEKAYQCLTGIDTDVTADSAIDAIQHYYDNPIEESRQGDEFIPPTQILHGGKPVASIKSNDSVLFFNFRGDRPRELTRAFIDDTFLGFDRGPKIPLFFVTMTEYESGLCKHVLFKKPEKMKNILGSYIAEKNIPQFRCAETEKYPHVTFFFNDYRDTPFPHEDRKLIPSPKDVTTYNQKPEMSAKGVTQSTQEAILSQKYGLIVVNFANPDMVGHTGDLEAIIKACEVVDSCVATLLKAIDAVDGNALITADHGNADQVFEPALKSPHTRHTLNPVKVILYGRNCKDLELKDKGRLADIAPTLLEMMELEQPPEMTGTSLIKH